MQQVVGAPKKKKTEDKERLRGARQKQDEDDGVEGAEGIVEGCTTTAYFCQAR